MPPTAIHIAIARLDNPTNPTPATTATTSTFDQKHKFGFTNSQN